MSSAGDITVLANLFRGIEGVGGKLTIGADSIHFRAHAVNFQKEPLDVPMSDIAKVDLVNTLGIVPNGLKVTTKTGQAFRFVVWQRKMLRDAILQRAGLS